MAARGSEVIQLPAVRTDLLLAFSPRRGGPCFDSYADEQASGAGLEKKKAQGPLAQPLSFNRESRLALRYFCGTSPFFSIGKAASIFLFALISRSESSRIVAGLKLGGVERGGYSWNVSAKTKTSFITPYISWT